MKRIAFLILSEVMPYRILHLPPTPLVHTGSLVLITLLVLLSGLLYGQDQEQKHLNYRADQVLLNPDQDKVTLLGNAVIKKKDQAVQASKIIMDNKNGIAEAFGNVVFVHRSQGIKYTGEYLRYYLNKDIIIAKGSPTLSHQSENIFIKGDELTGYLRENKIITTGNTEITLENEAKDITLITGETSEYHTKEKILVVETNVLIVEQEFENTDPNDDYVIACTRMVYTLAENIINCYENVHAENKEAESVITGDQLTLDKVNNTGLATGHAEFRKVNGTKTLITKADSMQLYQDEERIDLSGNVFITETNNTGKQLTSLRCSNATNYYGEKSFLECYENGLLSNFIQNSSITANFIYYNFGEESGYAEQDPVMFIHNKDKSISRVSSRRMDLRQKEKLILFKGDVYAYKLKDEKRIKEIRSIGEQSARTIAAISATLDPVEQSMTCKNSSYDYRTQQKAVFECRGNVIISNNPERTEVFSDRVLHYFITEHSTATGNVKFENRQNAPDEVIIGYSREIQNFGKKKELIFLDDVVFYEYDKTKTITTIISGDKFRYLYGGEERIFKGLRYTTIEKPNDNTTIYGGDVTYYISKKYAIIKKHPLFVQRNSKNKTKVLGYAKVMETYFKKNQSELHTNVSLIEVAADEVEPPLFNPNAFLQDDYSYITCDSGLYQKVDNIQTNTLEDRTLPSSRTESETIEVTRAQSDHDNAKSNISETIETVATSIPNESTENNTTPETKPSKIVTSTATFTCMSNVVMTDPAEKTVASGGLLVHNFTLERSILSEAPVVIITQSNTMRKISAEELTLDHVAQKTYFERSVVLEAYEEETLVSKLYCDHAIYHHQLPDQEIIDCQGNIHYLDLKDSTEITGGSLLHNVAEKYTFVTDDPVLILVEKNENKEEEDDPITVKADSMEKFDAENIIYAKGNVHITSGTNAAYASLGIYDLDTDIITLLGDALIRNESTGDEFASEQIIFDLGKKTMSLHSSVSGALFQK